MKYIKYIIFAITFLFIFSRCTGLGREKELEYKIEKILKIKDTTAAIIELDKKIYEKSKHGVKLSELSQGEKIVYFVENLEREINSGGFNGYFYNSSGDHAQETLEALKIIGANQTVEIVRRAYAEWPNAKVPKDWKTRKNLLVLIEDRAQETWNNCDEDFYVNEENIPALLFKYVKKNKSDFR